MGENDAYLGSDGQQKIENHDGRQDRYGNSEVIFPYSGPKGEQQNGTRQTQGHHHRAPPQCF